MPVLLGSKGQPDFTQPIELMMDCHRRIEHFLAMLGKVVDRCTDGVLDPQAAEALEIALNYFHQAGPRHTADEEQSLFPRLRRSDDPALRQAMAKIDRLEADHRLAEEAHELIERLGRAWLHSQRIDPASLAILKRTLDDLTSVYAGHIALEDQTVFVLAAQSLKPEDLREVGQEMKQRRLADPGRQGSRCAQRRLAAREAV